MTYNNYSVFNWMPVSEITGSVKPNNILVGKPNNLRSFYNLGLYRNTFKQNFLCDTPTAFAVKNFFLATLGQYQSFYLVSYQRDMTVMQAVASNNTAFNTVVFNQQYNKTNYVYIPTTQQIAKVTTITQNTDYYSIGLDTAFSASIPVGQWIANVYFVRFQQDNVDMKYSQGWWTFELNYIEVLT